MIIIHHNDADGKCAGAIVGRHAISKGLKPEYIEANYDKVSDPRWLGDLLDKCKSDGIASMVDFSLPQEHMETLHKTCDFTWIDHHKSCANYPSYFKGIRNFNEKEQSGCELAWVFCNPNTEMPRIVRLIGDYDTWRLKEWQDSKPLVVYLTAMQAQPDDDLWDILMEQNNAVDSAIEKGKIMTQYRDGFAKGLRESFGFETEFEGLKCYALNIQQLGSSAFGEKFKQYDACLAYIHNGQNWVISMSSDKPEVDCAKVMSKFGGGGHKGSAGCTMKEPLPFKKCH